MEKMYSAIRNASLAVLAGTMITSCASPKIRVLPNEIGTNSKYLVVEKYNTLSDLILGRETTQLVEMDDVDVK